MKQAQWHMVYTRPEREKKVTESFSRKGLKAYCPLNNLQVKYGNRKKIFGDPLFASYLFVSLEEHQLDIVLETKGVINFVYRFNKPAIINNEEIAAINFFLQDYPQVTVEKIPINISAEVQLVNEPLILRKGNVVEVTNQVSKVLLPSMGYAIVADTKKESSRTFVYDQESRIRI